jgi:glycosyltransferase involved in cell wall biosynthesis
VIAVPTLAFGLDHGEREPRASDSGGPRDMASRESKESLLSVVVPCFNESAVLPSLERRLTKVMNQLSVPWEVVFVDDGSSDDTYEQLSRMHSQDSRFKVIRFSRNFGHQTAVVAGLAHTSGEAVAVLDADLQDPPEVFGKWLEHWKHGYHVIYGVRQKRKENIFKRALYASFYRALWFFSEIRIPLDSGDFCLMDRAVVDEIVSMPERNVFVRGLRAWAGFRQIGIAYERDARAAGETKYPLMKLFKLAADGIFSFTTIPLRMAAWLGLLVALLCSVFLLFIASWRLFGFPFMGHTASELPGWAGGAVLVLFLGSVQLIFLGIIGEYIGRIYEESKARPRWIISAALGVTGEKRAVRLRRRKE